MTDANNERAQAALPDYPDTFGAPETEATITERFDKIVALHANRLAIDDGRRALTYGELDEATDRLAGALVDRLGPAAEPVALLYRHGSPFHVAQFGVFKAGKFYASLDAELAPNRLSLLLENLGARLLLCDSACEPLARSLANTSPGTAVLNTEAVPPASRESSDHLPHPRQHRVHHLHVGLDRRARGRRRLPSPRAAPRADANREPAHRAGRSRFADLPIVLGRVDRGDLSAVAHRRRRVSVRGQERGREQRGRARTLAQAKEDHALRLRSGAVSAAHEGPRQEWNLAGHAPHSTVGRPHPSLRHRALQEALRTELRAAGRVRIVREQPRHSILHRSRVRRSARYRARRLSVAGRRGVHRRRPAQSLGARRAGRDRGAEPLPRRRLLAEPEAHERTVHGRSRGSERSSICRATLGLSSRTAA